MLFYLTIPVKEIEKDLLNGIHLVAQDTEGKRIAEHVISPLQTTQALEHIDPKG